MNRQQQRLLRLERALAPRPADPNEQRYAAIDQRDLLPGESFEAAAARLHPTVTLQHVVRVVRVAGVMPAQAPIEDEVAADDRVHNDGVVVAMDRHLDREPTLQPPPPDRAYRSIASAGSWAEPLGHWESLDQHWRDLQP